MTRPPRLPGINDLLALCGRILINGRSFSCAKVRYERNRDCIHTETRWPSVNRSGDNADRGGSATMRRFIRLRSQHSQVVEKQSIDATILDLVHRKSAPSRGVSLPDFARSASDSQLMGDLIFVGIIVVFFIVSALYVRFCEFL